MSQANHQNIAHSAASEPKITSPHLVQQIAHAALKNVAGAKFVLDKHFQKTLIDPGLVPRRAENLVMHSGYEFGR